MCVFWFGEQMKWKLKRMLRYVLLLVLAVAPSILIYILIQWNTWKYEITWNEILFNEHKRVHIIKSSHSLHYYRIKLVKNIFGSKHHVIKQKLMLHYHILSEHCVPMSFSTMFLEAINLTICSYKHKVRDPHKIQT